MRVPALVLLWTLLPVAPAWCQVQWLCGLSADATRLVCVADVPPHASAGDTRSPTTTVRGTRFPLDPRQMYSVNFWAPATDLTFVEQLARATICYRSPGCEVIFSAAGAGSREP